MNTHTILLTGADGFIGSHLAELLVRKGYNVRALVLYNSFGRRGWLDTSPLAKDMDIINGDVRDCNNIRTIMKGCDSVLHLAALIAIPYSYYSPEAYIDTNIKGTLNILQAARDLDIQRIVHTSTSEVYGSARFVPITEEHPLQAQSPYSATKIAADQLALSFYYSFGTPITILRPFNTYGPRQSARAFIPTVITQLANGINPIKLGALYPTRDFSFVEDTASAFEAVLRCDATIGKVLNAGSEFEINMSETVNCIADIMGLTVKSICEPQRLRPKTSEVERLWANTHRLRQLTDWCPLYSGREGFFNGLQKTVEWFLLKENMQYYSTDKYIL